MTIKATFDQIISGRIKEGPWVGFKRIECEHGSMSIQVGKSLYCTPRNDEGPYTEVEVGYPDPKPQNWDKWDDGGSGVYAYVPIEKVREFIDFLGGEKISETDVSDIWEEKDYCTCGGPPKTVELFTSTVTVCSICDKDKK